MEAGPGNGSVRDEPEVQLRPVDQKPEGVSLPAVLFQVIPLFPVVNLQVVVVAVRRFFDAEHVIIIKYSSVILKLLLFLLKF